MPAAIDVRCLDWPFDFTAALLAGSGPLSAASGSAHIDPHLVVLLSLLAFWAVYLGLRLREIVAAAFGVGTERSQPEFSEKP